MTPVVVEGDASAEKAGDTDACRSCPRGVRQEWTDGLIIKSITGRNACATTQDGDCGGIVPGVIDGGGGR